MFVSFLKPPDFLWGPPSLIFKGNQVFSRRYSGRDRKLTILILRVSRLTLHCILYHIWYSTYFSKYLKGMVLSLYYWSVSEMIQSNGRQWKVVNKHVLYVIQIHIFIKIRKIVNNVILVESLLCFWIYFIRLNFAVMFLEIHAVKG
jgi:hypothetical protein